jgi:hypothetical protein
VADMRNELAGMTAAELSSLDDGSGDIHRALNAPGPDDNGCSCPATDGVIRHQRATCTDGIVAWFGWYAEGEPEPPGTVEAVVAASIEHHSRYRNELRHLPYDVLLARDEDGKPCRHCTAGPGHGMCQCVAYCNADGCWGAHR